MTVGGIDQCAANAMRSRRSKNSQHTSLLGDHSEREPPDPIPNSEVKPLSADDSVAVCHAKVGNCQALITKPKLLCLGFFLLAHIVFENVKLIHLARN